MSDELKSIRLVYNNKRRYITPIMPNGEPLPYVTSVEIISKVNSLVRIKIEAIAVEEKLIEGEFPVYSVTINADPAKIDISKLIAKFKNFKLIAP